MSQYDEGRTLQALIRPNQPIPVQQTGITETLNAPGLAPPELQVSRTAIAFGQLQQALGLAANVVHTAGTIARQARVDKEELDRKAQAADRGNASISVGEQLPAILGQIEQGTLVTTPEEIVQHISGGQSEAFQTKTAELVSERVANATEQRRQKLLAIHQTDHLNTIYQAVAGSSDMEDFGKAYEEAKGFAPDVPDTVIRGGLVKAALEHAKATGLTDAGAAERQVAAVEQYAGKEFSSDILIARNHIAAASRESENIALEKLASDTHKMLDAGAPYPTVLAFIAEQGKKLGVDVHGLAKGVETEHEVLHNRRLTEAARSQTAAERTAIDTIAAYLNQGDFQGATEEIPLLKDVPQRFILNMYDEVRSHLNAAITDSNRLVKEQERVSFTQEALSEASALWSQGRGGNISNFTRAYTNGENFHMAATELRDSVANQKLSQIASDVASRPITDAEKRAAEATGVPVAVRRKNEIEGLQMREIARNAYVPPQDKQTIESGGDSLSTAAFADTQAGQAVPLSPNALRGYELFKRYSGQAPGPLSSMNLSPRTRAIYSGAMHLEGIPGVGNDPEQALRNATLAASRPPSELDTVRMQAVAAALDIASKSQLDVARDAAPIAEILTRLGQTPDAAVAAAIKQVGQSRVDINGWSSRIGNIPPDLKPQFRDIANDIIRNYAKQPANVDAGIRRGNLAFRYDPTTDLWAMIDATTGLTVPSKDPNEVFYTTADLVARAHRLKGDPEQQRALFNIQLEENKRKQSGLPLPGFINPGSGF